MNRLLAFALLVAPASGRRRHLSERLVAVEEEPFNGTWAADAGVAWNATRRLTSSNLVRPRDHEVTSLPGLPRSWTGKHYAGMIDSDDANRGRLFYWFFPQDEAKPTRTGGATPLLIWLNGGPGCSSMDGLFLELGPLGVAGKASLRARASSWHRAAHVLFVDQPVGTGFSRTGKRAYCKDDGCITAQFETFLARFARSYAAFAMAKDGKTSAPVYFAGESHAGHYIPLLLEKLLFKATSGITWDVRGAALGNAWIDPIHQRGAASFFSLSNNRRDRRET